MQLKNKHADDYYESVYETSSIYIYEVKDERRNRHVQSAYIDKMR